MLSNKHIITSKKKPIGIIGGMGPYATLDFLNKIAISAKAAHDQQHVPFLLYSNPETPDRTSALLHGGASPLPLMVEGVTWLNSFELACVAIPCNTAHCWFKELQLLSDNTILHIAQVLCKSLIHKKCKSVAILSTSATSSQRIYESHINSYDIDIDNICNIEVNDIVETSIHLIKRGMIQEAQSLLLPLIDNLLSFGVEYIILGCTELPIALCGFGFPFNEKLLDPTLALAEECVRISCNTAMANIVQPA
ncbi:amino acid racemase [Pseudovibrio sp. Tun.PSC04-5.I4]|uniref:aspartate/glutamate racemase family protein n=1 Tax=Pseudovibrio sp. Tun.PSC04-5.I4 TaxID=1798213 RepID=UPI00088E308E|nr:amino acid racemase [Pseudovibrio sp. Tun.PSC04-5.I4]SDR49425.1 aspartate racemase [Pseudovibrio sp. Tun.PSC04-5.I4]